MRGSDISTDSSSPSRGPGRPIPIRARRGNPQSLLRRTISANSLSGSGSLESSATSDSMQERLRRDEPSVVAVPRVVSQSPPLVVMASSLASEEAEDEPDQVASSSASLLSLPSSSSSGLTRSGSLSTLTELDLVPESPSLHPKAGAELRRSSLKSSGEHLKAFFGLGKPRLSGLGSTSSSSSLLPRPSRQILGHYWVSRRSAKFAQRSLNQSGSRVIVNRLNTNHVDFSIELGAVTLIEPRYEEAGEMFTVSIVVGREVVLLSAGSERDTEELRVLLTEWVRFFNRDVVSSPRGSPRRGCLRGYLILVKKSGVNGARLWSTQVANDDILYLYHDRGREPHLQIDLSQLLQIEFSKALLEMTLCLQSKRYTFRCETIESFVYWKAGLLSYCGEKVPDKPKSATISLNFGT